MITNKTKWLLAGLLFVVLWPVNAAGQSERWQGDAAQSALPM